MSTSDRFDPYHKWFGIPPSQQPPTHYRLLGLEPFEPDREVIDAAANQRIAYLQDIAAGPHGDASQRLLNEVAAARRSLLNPKTKKVYDEQLQQSVATDPAPPKESDMAIGAAFAFDDDLPEVKPKDRPAPPKAKNQRALPRKSAPKTRNQRALPWIIGAAIALPIIIIAIIVAVVSGDSKSPETPVAKTQPVPPPKAPKRDQVRAAEPKNTPTTTDPIASEPPREFAPKEPPTTNPPPPTNPMPPVARPPVPGNGKWKIDGPELIAPGHNYVTFGEAAWKDYDFSCQARYDGVDGSVVLMARGEAQSQSAYFAQFGIGNAKSFLFNMAGKRLDPNPIVEGQGGLKPETWHKLTVKVRGNKIVCLADDKTVIEATDDKHPAGFVGFGGVNGVRIKDLRVVDPNGKPLFEGLVKPPE